MQDFQPIPQSVFGIPWSVLWLERQRIAHKQTSKEWCYVVSHYIEMELMYSKRVYVKVMLWVASTVMVIVNAFIQSTDP